MEKHYNLYYLFLEDQKKHLMSKERCQEIRKNIENYYKKKKPPPSSIPL